MALQINLKIVLIIYLKINLNIIKISTYTFKILSSNNK